MPNGFGVGRVKRERVVTGDTLKIIKTQFDANGFSHITFALQIGSDLLAQAGEDVAQGGAVMPHMQILVEGGFAAHRHRFRFGDHRSLVDAVGGIVQPCAIRFAKVCHQSIALLPCQIANAVDAQRFQFGFRFGPDAIDFSACQRPDFFCQVFHEQNGNAIGFVEFARHFRQQLVGRHTHRTGQACRVGDAFLNQPRQHPAAFSLATRHVGEIDVDLIHASVLHHRRDLANDVFEHPRVMAVLLKIHGQQDGVWTQLRSLHHPHGRAHTVRTRGIGCRGDDAAPCVAT